MLIFNWSRLGLLLLLVLALCCQCEAWLPWWMIPPHEQVGYTPAPALTTPDNPVVTPAMSEEPLSVVPESNDPLLALYSEAPIKTVSTLFWSSLVAPLLISCTPSFWWKLVISPISALVSYGLASGSSLGLHYLLSFLKVRFSNIISVILNSPDGLFLDALSFLCSNITLLLLVSTWFFILGLILVYVVYCCIKTPSQFPSISNQVTVVNTPSKKELSKKQIETF